MARTVNTTRAYVLLLTTLTVSARAFAQPLQPPANPARLATLSRRVANHATALELASAVGLDATTTARIVAHRPYGTAEAVRQDIGQAAFEQIRGYARSEFAPGTVIHVGGRPIPRLAHAPRALGMAQELFLKQGMEPYAYVPSVLTDYRSAEVAAHAVSRPLVRDLQGRPARLGKLLILRASGFNVFPSAGFVFRAAQHAQVTVLSYQNSTIPSANVLRAVTEVEGVRVPTGLMGRIFALGSARPIFVAPDQASDVFLEHFALLSAAQAQLGLDPLRSWATVITHSEGGLDTVITRDRLNRAGLGAAVGKVVAIASPIDFFTRETVLAVFIKTVLAPIQTALGLGRAPDILRANEAFYSAEAQQELLAGKQDLVDLSVGSVIGPRVSLRLRLGWPPYRIEDSHNIHPGLRNSAAFIHALGGTAVEDIRWFRANLELFLHSVRTFTVFPGRVMLEGDATSDGVIPLSSTRYGRDQLTLAVPHDHLTVIEDPAVVDSVVARLAR